MRTLTILDQEFPIAPGRLGPQQPDIYPEDEAIGAISLPDGRPAVTEWFIPRASQMTAGLIGPDGWWDGARDRAWSSPATLTMPLVADAINGMPGVQFAGNVGLLPPPVPQPDDIPDPTAFSALMVVLQSAATSNQEWLIGPDALVGGGNNGTTGLVMGSSGLQTYLGGTGTLLHSAASYRGQPVLVGVTFSTARGVTLRRNGVMVASDSARVQAIQNARLRLFSGSSSGQRFNGFSGHAITLRVDLSDPIRALDLEAIESTWLDFYGIARGS